MKKPTGHAKEKIDKMKTLYYVGNDPDFFNDLDAIIESDNESNKIVSILKQNLSSIVKSISIPYNLAANTAFTWLRNKIGIREAILGDKLSKKEIDDIVEAKFQMALDNQDEANELFENICNQLLGFTREDENLALELIAQGYLQSWSSFEVFLRDYIELSLNQHPENCTKVINSDVLKKRVDLKKIPYEFLETNKFNLSNRLGSLVTDTYDCSDLLVAKEIIKKIKDKEEISKVLDNKELWQFFQTRHLLIHKRGIVDQSFIDKSGIKMQIGEKVVIKSSQLGNTLNLIIKTVSAIVK